MAIAEEFPPRQSLDERLVPPVAISVATIAMIASALLVYVSGSFLVAEVFGVKRELQALLIAPIALAATYYGVSRPGQLLNPLVCFSIVRLGTEIVLRGQLSYVLDSLAAVFALAVLACAPAKSFQVGAKLLVTVAGIFALMALVQWMMLSVSPPLGRYVLVVGDADSDTGFAHSIVEHPIALLGFIGAQDYSFLGQPLARMHSFAKEPSLNVIYFMLPASLAFLLNSGASSLWGSVIVAFCILSLSGSVYLTLGFCGVWWLLLRVTSIRFAMPYGMLMLMCVFLFAVKYFGSDPLFNAITYLAQYGDFFSKSASLTSRTGGAIANLDAALASPFGSTEVSDIPGPWLINSALAAGWLGVLFLFLFLRKLGRQLDVFHSNSRPLSARWFGVMLLVGAMATVLVFNDYQMGNYSGLVLLAFICRAMQLKNQRDEAIKVKQ